MPGDGMDWPDAFFLSVSTVVVFTVVIVAIWQAFKTWQAKTVARVAIANDEAYRALAEQTTAAQRSLVEEQRRLADELENVGSRLGAVEKLLRDVG